MRISVLGLLTLSCSLLAFQQMPGAAPAVTPVQPANAPGPYLLGPSDQISIDVVELPEFHGKLYRVGADGTVDLPLIGTVRAEGRTVADLKSEIETRLHSQVLTPHVTASLMETKSQPVSVLGEVNNPGTQQMDGQRTLFDVLASAGGLKTDAGDVITITRSGNQGSLGLANATVDPASGKTTAEVKVSDLVQLRNPAVNIMMRAHDEVCGPRARLLYVIGNVKKPGGFTLSEKRTISALEALSLAEGLGPNAAPKSARILRLSPDSDTNKRQQIPVDLKRILAGKSEDMRLQPDDILYVPDNGARRIAAKTAETALATISGIAIWRGF